MAARPITNAERRAEQAAAVAAATRRLLAGGQRFGDLSVAMIAAEAGISRSAFYLHYPDKTTLLLRLAGEVRGDNLPRVSTWHGDDAATVDGLIETYAAVIATYRASSDVIAAINEAVASDPAVQEFWDAELSPFSSAARDDLAAGQDAGCVPADLDPDSAATIMVWGGDLVIRNHVAHGSPERDDVLARELGLSHWYGFFRRPPRHG